VENFPQRKELEMKSARILLLLACLLIVLQTTAAAYEPTNGDALVSSTYTIKTMAKEEVVALHNATGEKAAFKAVPMEPWSSRKIMLAVQPVYLWTDLYETSWRVGRVCSRFT
jgi:hypothetical protein